MGKTLSITLGTPFSKNATTVVAKKSKNNQLVFTVSKRQLNNAAIRIGIDDHKYLILRKLPDRVDYWTWRADGSFSIRMHDRA